MANYKIEPIRISTTVDIEQIRNRAHQRRCDELLGCAETLDLALLEDRLRLPVNATFPDPPDIVFPSDQANLAIEVSRVTWQRQSQVIAEADKAWPESLIELNPELLVDRQARRGTRGSKGQRCGDYKAIRLKGERLNGPGSVGGESLRATINALHAALERKKARLRSYSIRSSEVWLFLIDDGYPGAWADLLRREDFRDEIAAECRDTGFQRVYLYQFSQKIPIRLG